MTQANNRQGPGTESNRARAGRVSFAAEQVDSTSNASGHANASGHDLTGGHGLTARSVVAILPDGTRHVLTVPSRADLDAAKGQREQPTPAPGQVWLPPVGVALEYADMLDCDGTLTVREVQNARTVVFLGGLMHYQAADMLSEGWTCIGVATPNGRVMVGDGFAQPFSEPREVTAVGAGDSVLLRTSNGWEQWSNAGGLTDPSGQWTRTRYAPARAGERLRWRTGGRPDEVIDASTAGCVADPAQWERLDPGPRNDGSFRLTPEQIDGVVAGHMGVLREHQRAVDRVATGASPLTAKGAALDALAASMGIERRPAVEPSGEPVRFKFTIEGADEAGKAFRRLGAAMADIASKGKPGAVEVKASTLTLQAPAPDLRALFDAIGRALELPATRHACPFGAGLTVTVLRDEMLFTPTAETGIGTADLAGDARALCALREAVGEAMRNGAARLTQWGAKGPALTVRREGPAMGATTASEPAEPVRYTPSEGGADAWRWETGK